VAADRVDRDLLLLGLRRAALNESDDTRLVDARDRGCVDRDRRRRRAVGRALRRADDGAHRRLQVPLARQHQRLALEQPGAIGALAAVDEERALDVVQLVERLREDVRVHAVDAVVALGAHDDRLRQIPG